MARAAVRMEPRQLVVAAEEEENEGLVTTRRWTEAVSERNGLVVTVAITTIIRVQVVVLMGEEWSVGLIPEGLVWIFVNWRA